LDDAGRWDYERDFASHGLVDSKRARAAVVDAGGQLAARFGHSDSGAHFL